MLFSILTIFYKTKDFKNSSKLVRKKKLLIKYNNTNFKIVTLLYFLLFKLYFIKYFNI